MVERKCKELILNVNETFKVLMVLGPRQVGKTTLLKELMPKDMEYISLDDVIVREQAKNNPKLFLEEHPGRLFIDEVQYAPDLFSYIKLKVDSSNDMGQYWLTGSQQFSLSKNASETLAGRVGIIKMNSFSYTELSNCVNDKLFIPGKYEKKDYIDVNKLFEYIFYGGMPELLLRKNIKRNMFYSSYIDTYIERDIKSLSQIGDELSFRQFLVSVATRNGEQLNYTNIANEVGVSDVTIKKWISILESSGIIYLLEPFVSNKLKRITHMPKIVFMDTGLCAYLSGWGNARDLQLSSEAGHYLETYVISEIIKSYNALGEQLKISYYRDKEKNEIDLIMEKNKIVYPFEIKKTSDPRVSMISNFKKLESLKKEIGDGGIICCYNDLLHIDEKNYIIPISSVIDLH